MGFESLGRRLREIASATDIAKLDGLLVVWHP
jgi:hypothetical protein